MKKLVLGGVFLSTILMSGTAIAGPKWGQWGLPMAELERGFERIDHLNKYESMQYDQAVKWEQEKGKPLVDISKMYKAGILKKQYMKKKYIGVVEVGTNFYHLSGSDMQNVMRSFDTAYNYTNDGQNYIRIVDAETREEVGTYGREGLFLQ